MNKEDDLLTLAPLKKYKKPTIPTYKDKKPDLAKKMPKRWKNKAVAATAMGLLLSTTTLAGCGNYTRNELPNWSALSDSGHCWTHWGGSGAAPLYVAYLTEQEAMDIVRAELAAAGIAFTENETSESIIIDETNLGGRVHYLKINFFNEEHNIAITLVHPGQFSIPLHNINFDKLRFFPPLPLDQRIEIELERNSSHLAIGLFCTPESWVGTRVSSRHDDDTVTDEEIAEARERLETNLIDQTQKFINRLHEAGINE